MAESAQSLTSAPKHLEETPLGMSNLFHEIDEGFEEALRTQKFIGRHAAWDFNGLVWFDGEQFCEEVWIYRAPRAVLKAPTLRGLMTLVNGEYGDA